MRRWLIALATLGSFCALIGLIGWSARSGWTSPQMALLMGIATLGLYIGFGILIGAYRLIVKLDR